MKTNILRATLALLLCSTAVCGWGQDEYIINENFSDYPSNNPNLTEYHNWKVRGCTQGMNGNWSNYALKVENYKYDNKTEIGYAITPALGYVGDVYLTFNYARGASRTTTIDITIQNAGTFEDGQITSSIQITDGSQAAFYSKSYNILNTTEATTIMFSESAVDNTFAIDNVKVTKIPEIILKDSLDNSGVLPTGDPLLATVNTHRTLIGGIWNTLCLPFDVTMSDMVLALGKNQNIQLRTFSSYEANVLTFANANETTIPAGTPFLVKLNTTVKNPTFHAVTISNTDARTVTSNGVSFVGTYSPKTLLTNGTNLFLTTRNTLSIPASGTNTMNGLRAYFVVTGDITPAATRIAIDDETTALQPATVTQRQPTGTYDLSGQRILHSRHGLYVVDGRLTFVK